MVLAQLSNSRFSRLSADLVRLAGQANAAHQKAGESIVAALINGMEAGRALVQAQQLVPYGQWESWLAANFQGADRSARRWMRLYRERDRLPGGDPLRTGVSELTPSRALALLATADEPDGRVPLTPEEEARLRELEGVIGGGIKHGAKSWRILCRRIGQHPEGNLALERVVASARIGPPLPVSAPDLRNALETWSEHDLVQRLLHANECQHRLCGRILLAIETRGLFRPRFETFDEWREERGWSGEEIDAGLAWARANPGTPAEPPHSEADCCLQAWRLLQIAEWRDEADETADDQPSDQEKEESNLLTTACMRLGAAAGWPWHNSMELFARAMKDVLREVA